MSRKDVCDNLANNIGPIKYVNWYSGKFGQTHLRKHGMPDHVAFNLHNFLTFDFINKLGENYEKLTRVTKNTNEFSVTQSFYIDGNRVKFIMLVN